MAARVTAELGLPDVAMFNPSARVRGPFAGLDPEAEKQALLVTCYGRYLLCNALVAGNAARRSGPTQLNGATASLEGNLQSASFAIGKLGPHGPSPAPAPH